MSFVQGYQGVIRVVHGLYEITEVVCARLIRIMLIVIRAVCGYGIGSCILVLGQCFLDDIIVPFEREGSQHYLACGPSSPVPLATLTVYPLFFVRAPLTSHLLALETHGAGATIAWSLCLSRTTKAKDTHVVQDILEI